MADKPEHQTFIKLTKLIQRSRELLKEQTPAPHNPPSVRLRRRSERQFLEIGHRLFREIGGNSPR
jgi:hypothetical protein